MNTRNFLVSLVKGVAASVLISSTANAAVIHQVENGKLIGAKGVGIGDKTYDVEFVDGTCAAVFGTCEASSFLFKNASDAGKASSALLSLVFVNVPGGYQFDSLPSLIQGCTDVTGCSVYTPWGTTSSSFRAHVVDNLPNTDSSGSSTVLKTLNFADVSSSTFARWTLSATDPANVPEPATSLLFLAGAGALALRRRKSVQA